MGLVPVPISGICKGKIDVAYHKYNGCHKVIMYAVENDNA